MAALPNNDIGPVGAIGGSAGLGDLTGEPFLVFLRFEN